MLHHFAPAGQQQSTPTDSMARSSWPFIPLFDVAQTNSLMWNWSSENLKQNGANHLLEDGSLGPQTCRGSFSRVVPSSSHLHLSTLLSTLHLGLLEDRLFSRNLLKEAQLAPRLKDAVLPERKNKWQTTNKHNKIKKRDIENCYYLLFLFLLLLFDFSFQKAKTTAIGFGATSLRCWTSLKSVRIQTQHKWCLSWHHIGLLDEITSAEGPDIELVKILKKLPAFEFLHTLSANHLSRT